MVKKKSEVDEAGIKKLMKTEIPKNLANIIQNKKRIEKVIGEMKTDGNTEKYYKDYKKSMKNLKENIGLITNSKDSNTKTQAITRIRNFMEGQDVREETGKYGKKGKSFVDEINNQPFTKEDIEQAFNDLTISSIQSSKFNDINNSAFTRLKKKFEEKEGVKVEIKSDATEKPDDKGKGKKEEEESIGGEKKEGDKVDLKDTKLLMRGSKKGKEKAQEKKEEEDTPAPAKSPPTEEEEEKENAPPPTPEQEEKKEGEPVKLEDEATKDNTEEGEHTLPNETGEGSPPSDPATEAPQTETQQDTTETNQPEIIEQLQSMRPGSVPEIDRVDVMRETGTGGTTQVISEIVKNQEKKEDEQRADMKINRLKEEIKALHLLFDNNIKEFRENPHTKDRDDALASNDIEKVRAHHKKMERAVRDYYKSGNADNLRVGVIVPIDQYLNQYLSSVSPASTIPKVQNQAVSRVAHAGSQLVAKGEDRFNRAIAQNTFYQRGGMSSYKMRAVSNHTVKIGGRSRFGDVQDPKPRVDAPLQQYLKRPLKVKSSLKIKS